MKKILITGFNNEQTRRDGYLTKRIGVILCHYGLIRCLEDMDYEIEQKPTPPGTDLSGYDHVIVYLHSPQGFCQRLYDGLWAISQRPDAILAFDDWQVSDIYSALVDDFARSLEDGEKAFRPYLLDQYASIKDRDVILSYRPAYAEAISILRSKQNRVLVCAFSGGDLSKLGLDWSPDLLYSFNPNPYHLNRSWENNYGIETSSASLFDDEAEAPNREKEKTWVFSSLVQNKTRKWLNTLNLDWEVSIYGALRGKYKTERLTEDKMVQVYQKTWGNIMPVYDNAGSGWWRTRVLQCATARSITYCDPKEGHIYGEEFTNMTPTDIEQMDVDQLWAKAQAQHDCFLDNHPLDKKVTQKELLEVLDA